MTMMQPFQNHRNNCSQTPRLDYTVMIKSGDWPDDLEASANMVLDKILLPLWQKGAWASLHNDPEKDWELSLIFTNNAEMQALNNQHRGIDAPTNVLSFDFIEDDLKNQTPFAILGDIVFAYEIILQESQEMHIPFQHHLTHLIIHGFLHLLGYDHQTEHDAQKMEMLETELLLLFDIPDPYKKDSQAF
jgi:probable rRNA maturation factor